MRRGRRGRGSSYRRVVREGAAEFETTSGERGAYRGWSISSQVRWAKQERLGDGCKHIFFDVGANIGLHGRFLYEPELFDYRYNRVFRDAFLDEGQERDDQRPHRDGERWGESERTERVRRMCMRS